MNLFDPAAPFWKGNLHLHTTQSDGQRSPKEALALYQEAGYDFLAITDHRKITRAGDFYQNMLVLPGIELDYTFFDQVVHLIGVGMSEDILEDKALYDQPENGVRAVRAAGGQVILAHPAWSLNTLSMLARLKGVCAAEVFNSVSRMPWNGDRGNSASILDIAAAAGMVFPFVAQDDTHFYSGEEFGGYIMLQAPSLTREGVLDALEKGRFYASQGPLIRQISMEGDRATVECSPAERIVFYSNLPWVNGRCRQGRGMESAEYTLSPKETFLRVEILDEAGRTAWSSPIKTK